MELLDRYLQAAKFFLPRSQQEDILKELSENILSQVEDKESELGRPLTQAEQEALIKKHGHPVWLAMRYRSGNAVIGSALSPFYWLTVGLILGMIAVSFILQAIIMKDPGRLLAYFSAALPAVAWLTIIFAVLERVLVERRYLEKWTENWDPKSLPAVHRAEQPKSRSKSIFELVAASVCTLWFVLGLQYPVLILGPAVKVVDFAPHVRELFPLIVLVTLAGLGWDWANRFKSGRSRAVDLGRVVLDAASLVIIALVLRGGPMFVAIDPKLDSVAVAVNLGMNISLSISMGVIGILLVVHLFQYARRERLLPRGVMRSVF